MSLLGTYVNAAIVGQPYAVQGLVIALNPDSTMKVENPDGSIYHCEQAGATPVTHFYSSDVIAWISQKRKDLGL